MTFSLTISRTKDGTVVPVKKAGTLSPVDSRGGWWPYVREAFAGAWQRNIEVRTESVLTFSTVYACISLISADIGKLRIKLVKQDADGIWNEVESPAFSPVLRKPNRYQTRIQFLEQWMTSKLIWGNTYALKHRDNRGVVTSLHILDPSRCRPFIAPDGSVYYAINRDDLSQADESMVPASEIIHDRITSLYHPLVGISPISAAGLAAVQGLNVQNQSAAFFGNGSQPSGVLTAPGVISDETALRLKELWETQYSGANVGRVAVLGDGLEYKQMTMSAVDAQLIEQLKMSSEQVCQAFKVPGYMVNVGPTPAYNNVEALSQQYYGQTLQNFIESIEILLDEGLEMVSAGYGTEVDLDDLLRMDTPSRIDAASKAIRAGMSPNEVRLKFHDLGKADGGDTPFMQQQDWPLALLANRQAQDLLAQAGQPSDAPVIDDDADESEDLSDEAMSKAVTLAFRRELAEYSA